MGIICSLHTMHTFALLLSHLLTFTCYSFRCVGVETSLRVHSYVYTIQTVPLVGRVDLAAVFLDVVKLKQENLLFSEWHCVFAYVYSVVWLTLLTQDSLQHNYSAVNIYKTQFTSTQATSQT